MTEVAMNKKIWELADLEHEFEKNGYHIAIDNLYRVLKTKEALAAGENNPETIYKTMLNVTEPVVGRFPGDAELFNRLYSSVGELDARGLVFYMSKLRDMREMFVPEALCKNFMEHINDNVHSVLIPECDQFGTALFEAIENNSTVRFVLSSRTVIKAEILKCIYSEYKNVEIISADIYSYGFTNERFDLIASVPVFGGRMLVEGEDFISKEPAMIAVQNLLYHINMDGELVIVLPAKVTFAGGSAASLRDYIENNYKIKEIAAMPAGLFLPCTAINTYLFTIGNGITEDVVVKEYKSDKPIDRKNTCQNLVLNREDLLFYDEFSELSGWSVDIIFSEQDDDVKAYNSSSVKKFNLGDVATVFRGKAINTKSDKGNVGVINISDISDMGINYETIDRIDEEERKVARYALEAGDVLVTSRGTTIKVAVYENQQMTCIPSANINVIRPKEMLRGAFLKLFLESPAGMSLLKSLQRGTTVVNINYRDLLDLEVPVPSIAEQDEIIDEYYTGLNFYKETIAAAEEGWRGVQASVQSKLY